MKPNENELHKILGELFPAGEVADPHGKGVSEEEKREELNDEISIALAGGPGGIAEFLKRRGKRECRPVPEVEMHPDGLTISLPGRGSVRLDPIEVLYVQHTLGEIIERQVQFSAIMRLLRKLGFQG